ncbi:MAG: PorT family protein [Bacteroidales bacterium]|nr:PorT family protein [Bacteroidales bacterium]MCM1147194.1 PorT family protein [Bacteroidales bacterium]MCM1205420.1 PorT family protein [Bacillota bacterium]MCM1509775.1 PorT family protein [Clostridium sp.]
MELSINYSLMKRIVLLLVFCAFHICMSAQRNRLGVTAGLLLSQPEDVNLHVGYSLGVTGEFLLSDKMSGFYLSPSLLFVEKGWRQDVYDLDDNKYDGRCDAYYLEVPVMAGYKWHINGDVRLFVEAGAYVACGLFGNYKLDYEDDEFDDKNIFSSNAYRRFDWGVKAAVGVDVAKWKFAVGYGRSLQKPTKDNWNIYNLKDRSFSLSVSYMIN